MQNLNNFLNIWNTSIVTCKKIKSSKKRKRT